MSPLRKALGLWLLLASTISGPPAQAYVRTTNEQGSPIYWKESCVFLTPDAAGCPDVSVEQTKQAIAASVQSWNDAAQSCQATIQFQLEDPRPNLTAGFNPKGKNTNVIVWLTDHWGNDQADYDPQALALTTLTFISDEGNEEDGRILDADIEFNSVTKQFTTDPTRDKNAYDIQNDLTHELGHVLGLDHTCYDGWFSKRPTDDQGHPIPDCSPASQLPVEIKEATMYPYSQPDETDKRSLEQDDIDGVCGIYPTDRKAGPCKPVDLSQSGCGCRSGGQGASLVVLLVFLFMWLTPGTRSFLVTFLSWITGRKRRPKRKGKGIS